MSTEPTPPTIKGVLAEIERAGSTRGAKPPPPESPHKQLIKNIAIGVAVVLMFVPLGLFFLPEKPAGPQFEGYHDNVRGVAVGGWAWDAAEPDKHVEIEISDGVNPKVILKANRLRDDLRDMGRGDGRHGFYYPIPPQQRDGKTYTVTVKIVATGRTLENTPRRITYDKD